MQGIVVRIPVNKDTGERLGFLFVRGEDGIERFVHRTGFDQATTSLEKIKNRDRVEFTPDDDAPKGPRAKDLRVLD